MSRQLKRVALDFSWPLQQVWDGYLNPYAKLSTKCPYCEHGYDRTGGRPGANAALFLNQWYGNAPFDPAAYGGVAISPEDPAIWDFARRNIDRSPAFYKTATFGHEVAIAREALRLYAECFYGHWCHHLIQADVDALVTENRLWDFTRVPRDAGQALVVAIRMAFHAMNSWLPESNGYRPTAAEVNVWSRSGGLGHDSFNAGICVRARCAREGVPVNCVRCQGSAEIWPSPEVEKQHEDWKPTGPPVGDGYQLWENCSEGSPVSPVFATLDELCAWLAEHETTFADFRATEEEWRKMLGTGFVYAQQGNAIFT